MKALRLIQPRHPLEAAELPVPEPGVGDVLVRVRAAGICHSDTHYRAGRSPVQPLPLTLGHEVAGVVERIGSGVTGFRPGDRVCLHYLATCGQCRHCHAGHEQFCVSGQMMGKHRDGGFAEFVVMPTRAVFALPDAIAFEHGAVMMCSSATSLHALRQARLQPGESVAVFGLGGLGISALQLAAAFGAHPIFAVDIQPLKLKLAERLGAVPVNADISDPVGQILALTSGKGVDVALELIGLPLTMRQATRSLAIRGRAALAGITDQTFSIAPYPELLNKEAEVIGVSDHLAQELPLLIDLVARGKLDLAPSVTRAVPLEPTAVNQTLDQLENGGPEVRTVIVP